MSVWEYPLNLYDKQQQAVSSPADQVLFGGSLAGGKTEMIIKHLVDICCLVPGAKTLLVRKNFPQMVEIEQRLRLRIPSEIATLNKSDHVLTFKHNEAQLRLGYLDSDDAAENYQGHEYVCIAYDELTHYDESWVDRLNERIRATGPIAEGMERNGLKLRMLAASNPGSRGHGWVKERFIDPAPAGELFEVPVTDTDGEPLRGADGQPITMTRQFIPSSLWDNPYLNHDKYLATLAGMDPERKRAMIYGDWSVPAGTRFPQFREAVHVIKPEDFPVPVVGATRVVGVDYGFNDPFAAVWIARVGEQFIVYRDHVEKELSSSEQAERVLELESDAERLHSDVTVALDPNAWIRSHSSVGPRIPNSNEDEAPMGSIAYNFKQALGDRVVKGWNPRVQGWALLDQLMVPQDTGMVDHNGVPVKVPRILIYDTCRDVIKALQSAPRAKRDPQDIDHNWKSMDHQLDALRYGCAELLGMRYRSKMPASERLRYEGESRTLTADVMEHSF